MLVGGGGFILPFHPSGATPDPEFFFTFLVFFQLFVFAFFRLVGFCVNLLVRGLFQTNGHGKAYRVIKVGGTLWVFVYALTKYVYFLQKSTRR